MSSGVLSKTTRQSGPPSSSFAGRRQNHQLQQSLCNHRLTQFLSDSGNPLRQRHSLTTAYTSYPSTPKEGSEDVLFFVFFWMCNGFPVFCSSSTETWQGGLNTLSAFFSHFALPHWAISSIHTHLITPGRMAGQPTPTPTPMSLC